MSSWLIAMMGAMISRKMVTSLPLFRPASRQSSVRHTIGILRTQSFLAPSTASQSSFHGQWYGSLPYAPLSNVDIGIRLRVFQHLFEEARSCIEEVEGAKGSENFHKEVKAANEAVNEAVEAFQAFSDKIDRREEMQTIIIDGCGRKVEQLKGELALALKGDEDH